MSSLKDWYRYVDSKARHRPEGHPPAEGERAADERSAGQPPAESGVGEAASEPPAPASGEVDAAAGEEALDVWSGLFPARRKPEPKPTTAPLRPPSEASLDQLPADLPFTQTPIETPPTPQFHLPEAAAAIPSFDDFVSPFAPEPAAPPPPVAAASATGAPPPEFPAAPPIEVAPPPSEISARAAAPSTEQAPASAPAAVASLSPEAAAPPAPSPAVSATADTVAPESVFAPPPESAATVPVGAGSTPVSPPAAALPADEGAPAAPPPSAAGPAQEAAAEPEPGDDDQIRWRSPFPLPGPGRTVSSGAPGPRPEPTVPRVPSPTASVPEDQAATLRSQVAADAQRPTPTTQRPAPGSPEWERERVERLARTFRDTLRSLEQSLAVPRTEAPDAGRPAPDFGGGRKIGAGEELLRTAIEPLPAPVPEAPIEAPPVSPIFETAGAAPREAEVVDTGAGRLTTSVSPEEAGGPEPAVLESAVAAPIEAAVAPEVVEIPPAEVPYAAGTPDVLRNIQEAALIRQRLPQHMEMLLRIPTNEVAQNSYKSPFRETREDLIGRLLDPQLTLEEAARILGVCPTTVRRYTNRGMLHCHRTPGNQRRFRMSDVLQFLEQFGDRIDRAAEAKQYEEAAGK